MRDVFTTAHFGPLNHVRAGERILYRVRLRLVDMWAQPFEPYTDKLTLWDAICMVDACLTDLRRTRRV